MLNTAALSANPVARNAHWLVLAVGFAVCLAFGLKTAAGYGLWFDELCSLFYGDPDAPLSRLAGDTHPPVHYFLVRVALTLGLPPVAALWSINFLALGGGLVAMWFLMRKAGYGAFAIAACGLVLVTPGVLRYLLEGRNYLLAQSACVVLAAAALIRLDTGPRPRSLVLLCALSVFCGAIHMYSGLFAGSIGGALVVLGVARKDRDLTVTGLAVGAAASIVTLAWAAIIYPLTVSGHPFIGWLSTAENNGTVWTHLWVLATYTGVKLANLALLIVGVGLCAFSPTARKHVAMVALTALLFVAVPAIVSLVRPMITGRYLAIASPALVVMAAFAAWRAFFSTPRPQPALVGALAVSVFALVLAVLGPGRAEESWLAQRNPYSSDRVAELLAGQPPRTLRVKVLDLPPWGSIPVEEIYMSTFRNSLDSVGRGDIVLESSFAPPRDIAGLPPGIAAWSQDSDDETYPATTAAALAELGLTNATRRPVRLEQTEDGYLLLLD